MKNFICSLVTILLTASVLLSCNDSSLTIPSGDGTPPWAVTTDPDAPSATDPLPPFTDPMGDPAVYPNWEAHGDIDLLAELGDERGELTEISRYGDHLLLSFAQANPEGGGYVAAYARTLNVITGVLSAPIPFSEPEACALWLESGSVCVYNPLAATAKVYDRQGKQQFRYEHPDGTALLSIDRTGEGILWCYSGTSACLTKVSLSGGEVKQFTVPSCTGGYIAGHRDGAAYYCGWDGMTNRYYAITPDGGVKSLSDVGDSFWGGGVWYTDQRPNRLVDPADPKTVYILGGEDSFSWIAAGAGTHLLTAKTLQDGVGTAYSVLDYMGALRYPEISVEEGTVLEHFLFAEDGTLYFVAAQYAGEESQTYSLCRWNYLHNGEKANLQTMQATQTEADNAKIAAAIGQKWGISVIYAEPQLHQVASDYSTVAVTDPMKLQNALLQLQEALSAYPDGFFADLCYGSYTRLELYLCGKFTPLTAAGINNAEALSNTRGSAMVIGFDVNLMDGEYVRVLAHELLHIMERRIDQIDADALSEWIALTPGGHDAYYYSYHDENGNQVNDRTHTYSYESDPADAYFVDAYSKSFPTEDRARVFEKLMASGGDPYFADSPVLMEKARTLCRLIRRYFPSVAAVERASWEVE